MFYTRLCTHKTEKLWLEICENGDWRWHPHWAESSASRPSLTTLALSCDYFIIENLKIIRKHVINIYSITRIYVYKKKSFYKFFLFYLSGRLRKLNNNCFKKNLRCKDFENLQGALWKRTLGNTDLEHAGLRCLWTAMFFDRHGGSTTDGS